MKTDLELLELAAKAAAIDYEIKYVCPEGCTFMGLLLDWNSPRQWWNPLADDGDALRLMTSMFSRQFELEGGSGGVCITIHHPLIESDEFCEIEGRWDRAKATRRAIVRAAAAIGESME